MIRRRLLNHIKVKDRIIKQLKEMKRENNKMNHNNIEKLKTQKYNKNFYQDGKLIDRIDWEKLMPMSRCAGGHDDQMQGLLKDVTIIAHWNEGDWQGSVATCVRLNDTQEIVIYNDYYGSCPGCDAWEGATDDDVKTMCKQLAGGALIFQNLEECKKFLSSNKDATQYDWSKDVCNGLLQEMNADQNESNTNII